MKTRLDIKKLIESAEQLIYDDKIEMAERGEIPIQIMEAEDGTKYQLKIVMTLIKNDDVTHSSKKFDKGNL